MQLGRLKIELVMACSLAAVGLPALGGCSNARSAPPEDRRAESDEYSTLYTRREVAGFSVYVNNEMERLGGKRDKLVGRLRTYLEEVVELLPPECMKELRATRIWVDYAAPSSMNVTTSGVAHYVSLTADSARVRPFMRGGIRVFAVYCLEDDAHRFLDEWHHFWLIHEFAHAYHQKVLKMDNPRVTRAYEGAMGRGLYQVVEGRAPNWELKKVVIQKTQTYARANQAEYFAELSVAYLARNWAYPYQRIDLCKYDPQGFALMAKVWGADDRIAMYVITRLTIPVRAGLGSLRLVARFTGDGIRLVDSLVENNEYFQWLFTRLLMH